MRKRQKKKLEAKKALEAKRLTKEKPSEPTDAVNKTTDERSFNPHRIAASDRVKKVVQAVIDEVVKYEVDQGLRKRRRKKKDQKLFEDQVEALICDLIHCNLTNPCSRVHVSLSGRVLGNNRRYRSSIETGSLVTVIDRLNTLGFLVLDKATKWENGNDVPDNPEMRRQSTMTIGPRLQGLINNQPLNLDDFDESGYGEVILLRAAKTPGQTTGDLMDYEDTDETNQMRQDLHRINDQIAKADITYNGQRVSLDKRRLVRIFNNGQFDNGGRYYRGFWIELPNKDRLKGIRINGEKVKVLDYSQMNPRLLYDLAGAPFPGTGAYNLPGLENYRDEVKHFFNALLNMTFRPKRFPDGTRGRIPRRFSCEDVLKLIEDKHRPVRQFFYQDPCIGLKLMFKESEIMTKVLIDLIDEGIVALPVHDAVIIQESHAHKVKEVMLRSLCYLTAIFWSDELVSEDG